MRGPAYRLPLAWGIWLQRSRRMILFGGWLVIGVVSGLVFRIVAEEPPPLRERIDRLVESSYVGEPAAVVGDAEFFRRVSLDLTGRIPPVADVRAFLADPATDKRERLVDRLLSSAAFVRHMTDVFDVMWMERRRDQHVPSAEWRQYLFDSIAAGKPLHVLIREILSSDGTDAALRPAAKFFLDREADANLLTRDVARMFFGMDLQCAQCHDHPLIDDYRQTDYYGIFAFLNRTVLFLDAKDKNKAYLGEKAEGDVKYTSAFTKEEGSTLPRLPLGDPIEDPILAKEDLYIVKPDKNVRPVARYSRRLRLAEEATSGNNWAFNRNLANRLWALMMGCGLVDPVDLSHSGNPPSHALLLDELAADLAAHHFDVRYFLREIVLSRTYQRAIDPPRNWAEQAAWAAEHVAALAQELAECQQAYQAIADQVQQLAAELAAKRQEQAPLKEAWRQAEQAWADAHKSLEGATTALEAARQALTTQQELHQALVVAQTAAQKAATLAGDQQELKAALDKLQASVTKAEAELKKSQDAVQEKQTAFEAAKSDCDALATKRQAALEQWSAAAQPIHELEQRYRAAQDEARRALDRLLTVRRRQQDAQWLADQRTSLQNWATVVQQLAQLQQALHNTLTQVEACQKDVETAQQAEQALAEQLALQRANPSPDTARLQELDARVAAARQTRQQAEGKLQQLRRTVEEQQQAVAAAQQQLQEATASVQDILAELENRWMRQHALAPLKPLTPEQLAWSMWQATGMLDNQLAAVRAEIKQKNPQLSDPSDALDREVERALEAKLAGVVHEFVRLFGAGPAQPQHTFFATVDQALYLANGGTLRSWLAPSGNNLTARLMAMEDAGAIAEELYLSVLTRLPDNQERQWVAAALQSRAEHKAQTIQELAWALLTSAEFRFAP